MTFTFCSSKSEYLNFWIFWLFCYDNTIFIIIYDLLNFDFMSEKLLAYQNIDIWSISYLLNSNAKSTWEICIEFEQTKNKLLIFFTDIICPLFLILGI